MGSWFGNKTPAKSAYQIKAEDRQAKELDRLTKKEDSMKAAIKRGRRGRATLISNDERGITENLGGG